MNKINFKNKMYIVAITAALTLSPSLTQSEDQAATPKLVEENEECKIIDGKEECTPNKSETYKKDAEKLKAEKELKPDAAEDGEWNPEEEVEPDGDRGQRRDDSKRVG
jgi:hypothetical protein